MEKLGEVYLATTESEQQRGWIKCGMTTRDSVQRVKEGNVASVREKYEILYRIKTPYYLELEKHMHDKFENQKEWIKVSYAEAYAEIHRFLNSKEELKGQIATLLGGRSAEEVVFGKITTGASNDLQRATDIAEQMVGTFGMSDILGPLAYDKQGGGQFLGNGNNPRRSVSDATAQQ